MPSTSDAIDDPRQGDCLPDVRELFVLDVDGSVLSVETPEGVALLTQCCDLARGGRGYAHVAKVSQLSAAEAGNAKRGRARHIPLPELGESLFADMGVVGGMTHDAVAAQRKVPGVAPAERYRFGERVGRRFARFAYPDDAQPLISWIVDSIRKKADSPNSPMAKFWKRVLRVRLEASGDWEQPPWDLTLLVIVQEGELPTLESIETLHDGRSKMTDLTTLATTISTSEPGTQKTGFLWRNFEELYADLAQEAVQLPPELLGSFVVEVLEENDLSYSRYRRSANLDVDHVSGPLVDL